MVTRGLTRAGRDLFGRRGGEGGDVELAGANIQLESARAGETADAGKGFQGAKIAGLRRRETLLPADGRERLQPFRPLAFEPIEQAVRVKVGDDALANDQGFERRITRARQVGLEPAGAAEDRFPNERLGAEAADDGIHRELCEVACRFPQTWIDREEAAEFVDLLGGRVSLARRSDDLAEMPELGSGRARGWDEFPGGDSHISIVLYADGSRRQEGRRK